MNTFSIGAALRFGWETFKKRPAFFVGVTLVIAVVSWIAGMIASLFGEDGGGIIGAIINLAITTIVDLGVVALLLKAYDNPAAPQFADLWHPQQYLPYLGATILMGIIVVVGLILLIVPGILAAVMLMFTKFIVVDRNLGPIEALKESARITKGNRLTLFLFMVVIAVINIVGALLLFVPLLVTIPISGLAMVYAYRTVGHKASEVVPAAPQPVSA
jgi:uncharacterized membrane protein